VFDPYSTLLSADAEIGTDNVFYPGVVINGTCRIGNANTFHVATHLLAGDGARIIIGNGATFGPGGVQITVTGADVECRIGNRVRLRNGAEIVGPSVLGTGSQVLGPISARNVHLAPGGDFAEPNPDLRGAVLKGFGRAQGIRLGMGEVINGLGDFAAAPVERQLTYHPR
jgi:UDP-3-O-[3-hydroxymyristoyl] glucosamine N-acyltransferase